MTVATDPAGALSGIWQAGQHIGTELANEDATVVWNEQLGPDLDGAKRFYEAVFGFTYDDVPGADAAVLRVGELGGTLIRPAADSEYGRIAVDHGATFALTQDTSES